MVKFPFRSLILIAIFFSFLDLSYAAQVSKVRGKSVLIDTQGEQMSPGDIYFVIDLNGARKAIIRIARVKGNRAIGQIGKGRAEVGMGLEKRGTDTSRTARSQYSSSTSSASGYTLGTASDAYWGAMLGIGFDSMTADVITDTGIKQGTAATKGTSFSLKGLYDHRLFDKVWFRGLFGIEGLKTEGGSNCGNASNQACNVDITYLSADALGRYLFSEDAIRPWVGGGLSLLFPLSKSSTLLQNSSITNTYALLFAGGVDWQVSPTMTIPVSVEYGMLPKSETVEASWIQIRGGVAFPF